MLRVKQEENEENKKQAPPVRIPAPPQPAAATLSEEDEVFLSRLRSGETLTGGQRVLPTLKTPAQTVAAAPNTLSLPEWWEHLITNNPVFQKESLAQKRLQEKKQPTTRATEKLLGILAILGLYGGMFYLMSLALASSNPQSGFWGMHGFLIVLQCLVLMIAMPLQGATTITSEREKMTWNALLLSRNSPLQILVGKAAATLRPIALFYGGMLPALAITAWGTGMTAANFLAAQVLILITAVLNVTIATYCSLVSKKSQQASGNAGGWAIVPLLGLPGITAITYAAPALIASLMNAPFAPPPWFHWMAWLINLFNPALAIFASLTNALVFGANSGLPPWLWFFVPTFYLVVSSLTIRGLWKRMLEIFWNTPKDLSG
jgi:hypothetical protein